MPAAGEVYRAYVDAESRRDVDAMRDLLAPDITIELNGRPGLGSAEADAAAMDALFGLYPDYRREIVEIIDDGDRVAARWRMVGQPRADMIGRLPPLDVRGCTFATVEAGRMVRAHVWSPGGAIEHLLAAAGSDRDG
jgi:predicted ester cyclase